ncbi:phage tail sheath C-terminal domain-containing protein [Parabacteroides faecis]|uniref:phage tail sheath C-terminal domain-containing protein n=1 Tax=Parabacteroides faecis TaxID=1217282 RepID=UPI003521B63A
METMKTPGVYIVEKSAFPNSVVPVATAVPAFIGHTQIAMNGTKSLLNVPFRITSMLEYNKYFGGGPQPEYSLSVENQENIKDAGKKLDEKDAEIESVNITINTIQNLQEEANNLISALEEKKPEGETTVIADRIIATVVILEDDVKTFEYDDIPSDAAKIKTVADNVKELISQPDVAKLKANDIIITSKDIQVKINNIVPKLKNERKQLVEAVNTEIKKLYSVSESLWSISEAPTILNTLYYNIVLFFANGGGACYIVSVGDYSEAFTSEDCEAALTPLTKEMEPTMLIIPEAVNLSFEEWKKTMEYALGHCDTMKNRVAILDIFEGYKPQNDPSGDVVKNFRENIGSISLDYAAAYYPWINTSVVSESDIDTFNLTTESAKLLLTIMQYELGYKSTKKIEQTDNKENATGVEKADEVLLDYKLLNTLLQSSPFGALVRKEICKKINRLPVAAAMAGIYTKTDNTRGVWKAPANVSINKAVSPTVNLTNNAQEDLNVDIYGRSINAIRYFKGEGVKVWGTRTLDGNSGDWRYINVRRTMIFLEESIKNAARAYVFEPNVASTWLNMKAMIENFLLGVWKQGGLAGASPEDAYSVHVGLGDTMTPEDILEGILRITALVAISHPAEFIEITFQQQMQKS